MLFDVQPFSELVKCQSLFACGSKEEGIWVDYIFLPADTIRGLSFVPKAEIVSNAVFYLAFEAVFVAVVYSGVSCDVTTFSLLSSYDWRPDSSILYW